MATSTFAARRILTLTNGQPDYPFTLEYHDQADLILTHYPLAGGEAFLGLGTQYTVTDTPPSIDVNPFPGGTIHLTFDPPTGDRIVLRRRASPLQGVHARQNRPLPGPALETALDMVYLKLAEIDDLVSRAFVVPETEPVGAAPGFSIPPPEDGKFLVGDANGDYTLSELFTTGVITVPVPVAQGGTGATVANDARNNLGLGNSATRNTGISNGNVPLIGSGGTVPRSVIPTGAGSGDIPALGSDGLLPASMLPPGGGMFYPLARILPPSGSALWDIPLAAYGSRVVNGGVRLVVLNGHPSTAANVRFRVGKGGSLATANYYSAGMCINSNDSVNTFGSTTPMNDGAYVALELETDAHLAAAAARPSIYVIDVFPGDGSTATHGLFQGAYPVDGGTQLNSVQGSWYHRAGGVVDRLRLYLSTGTWVTSSPFDVGTRAYLYAMVMP